VQRQCRTESEALNLNTDLNLAERPAGSATRRCLKIRLFKLVLHWITIFNDWSDADVESGKAATV
jgi:hypothetical protein